MPPLHSDKTETVLPLKILIVEDDDDARASLKDILELDSHRVFSTTSAKEAFRQPEIFADLDLMILDRRLPDGLAEDLLPQFFERAPLAKAIIVTGFADLDGTISALRAGASDFIIKPINPEALLLRLASLAKQRRIENELAFERQFAQQMLETAEAAILVVDENGNVVRFNPFLVELTGRTLDEARGLNWSNTFIRPCDRDRLASFFEDALGNGRKRGTIGHILDADGNEIAIRWSATPLVHTQGVARGVLAVGLDVTDLTQVQNELLQAERLAAIGQTMAGLAHESRNALQRIKSSVDLLEDGVAHDPAAARDLSNINRAANDLRDLLEEVRDYAAPIVPARKPASVSRVWQNAWDSLRRAGRVLPQLIATACENDVAYIDERRLEQVFRNLFENSAEACGGAGEIRVASEIKLDMLRIVFSDNGAGMSDQLRGRIFQAFYTTKPTGTGLGLSIVQRIVTAHRGNITADKSEAGARFTLNLPRQPTSAQSTTQSERKLRG